MRKTRRMASKVRSTTHSPRLRLPAPIFFIVAITQLSSSSFLASAQYVRPLDSALQDRYVPHYRREQSSSSREVSISSFSDFCLFGPPDPFNYVWSSGLNVVSWCAKDGHGTRLIPDGTLHGVTFVKTPQYVQVSGTGDFTKINWAPGDVGGQFDNSHNTPDGASVKVDGKDVVSWVTLISANTFCFRACTGDPKFCPHQYDQLGCWFLTGNAVGSDGTWQDCQSDEGDAPGVAGGKTYDQNGPNIPDPTSPPLSACQPGPSVSNGQPAPPLYPWKGDTIEAGTSQSAPGAGGSAQSGGQGSTTWLPVETCQPCAQQPVSAATMSSGGVVTGASTSRGLTEQVGVTQVKSDLAVAVAQTGGTTSKKATTTAALNDQLDRREHLRNREDSEIVTKNGQCCHTTWTPSIIGASATTHAHGGVTASTTRGSVSTSGSTGLTAGANSTTKTTTLGNGTISHGNRTIVGGNTTVGNGTNGTGNGTSAAIRAVEGLWGSLGSLLLCTSILMAAGAGGLGAVL